MEPMKCDFSHFTAISCGKSIKYTEDALFFNVAECNKNTESHLAAVKGLERHEGQAQSHSKSKGLVFHSYPEALLILYRSGIFNIDSRSIKFNICQAHRDYFGIYWIRNKTKCCYPEHLVSSKAKPDRGASPTMCKEYWLKTREFIAVGSGICKQCSTKHRENFLSSPQRVTYEEDIEYFEKILQHCEHEGEESCFKDGEPEHNQQQDVDSQLSYITQTTSTDFSQQSHSDWELENTSDRERFNRAMNLLSKGNFPALKSQLKLPWKDVSKSTKSLYLNISSEAVRMVLDHVVPGQVDIIIAELAKKHEIEDDTLENQEILTKALIKAYLDQDNRLNQVQILSLFANKFSKEKLLKLIPGLTVSKIDTARKHAAFESPGQIINKPKIYRMRLSQPKVLHFIQFICSPAFHQAVGYGSKKLQLSSGVEIVIPMVVRNIISSRLIRTYLAYCKDQEYQTFSRSTLFNIMNVCVASQKKNLHGLDNITADGLKAVEVLTSIISKLQTFGLSEEHAQKLNSLVASLNQLLKFEIKGHLTIESSCIDHCTTYSLSDPTTVAFSSKCNHEHSTGCDECEVVERTLIEVNGSFENIQSSGSIPSDLVEEISHEINQSKMNIIAWKAHCIRTVHQDQAKQNVLNTLQPNQALIVMDWAMKCLPIKHREAQSDFFGKKGISWHVASVVTLAVNPGTIPHEHLENRFQVHTMIHILQLGIQGWFSVAHIITDLFRHLPGIVPDINEVILKSDNAGCYHCTGLVSYIHHLNTICPIKVVQYNFSEAQSGKDICDAKTAHCKMHILRFSGEGHDVVTADDMLIAINSNGGIKCVIASVVSVDQKQEVKSKTRITSISLMNNMTFQSEGVTFRKAYGIGNGYFLPRSQFKDHASISGFEVHTPFYKQEAFIPGSVKHPTGEIPEQNMIHVGEDEEMSTEIEEYADDINTEDTEALFACPEQSCIKMYTKPHFLEAHICIGKHVYSKNENSYDSVKKLWADKCMAVDHDFKVLLKSASIINVDISEGWALKTTKPQKRFSSNVKEFLHGIYIQCNSTGKRPNFESIASDLKVLRNEDGAKKFNSSEWLTHSQIRSLFANFVKFGSRLRTETPFFVQIANLNSVNDEDLQNTLEEMDSVDFHASASDLARDIISQFE